MATTSKTATSMTLRGNSSFRLTPSSKALFFLLLLPFIQTVILFSLVCSHHVFIYFAVRKATKLHRAKIAVKMRLSVAHQAKMRSKRQTGRTLLRTALLAHLLLTGGLENRGQQRRQARPEDEGGCAGKNERRSINQNLETELKTVTRDIQSHTLAHPLPWCG